MITNQFPEMDQTSLNLNLFYQRIFDMKSIDMSRC